MLTLWWGNRVQTLENAHTLCQYSKRFHQSRYGVAFLKSEKPLWLNDFLTCQKLAKFDSPKTRCRLRSQILCQVGNGVALDGHTCGGPGEAGGGGGVHTGAVVDEVGREGGVLELSIRQLPGQLMDDGANHFQMPQLFGAYIGVKLAHLPKNTTISWISTAL